MITDLLVVTMLCTCSGGEWGPVHIYMWERCVMSYRSCRL